MKKIKKGFLKVGDTLKVSKKRMSYADDSLSNTGKVQTIEINNIIFRTGTSVKKIKWQTALQDKSIVITLDNGIDAYAKDLTNV